MCPSGVSTALAGATAPSKGYDRRLAMEPGTLVADKYRIVRPLGKGGMASVFVAVHEGLGQEVALKLMSPTEAPGAVERFRREAQILARLRGEHVARAIDFGTVPGGQLYLVLEYLEGRDFHRIVHEGPLSIPIGVGYILQACEALAEAHAAGLVHRDIKPGNLFLARRPDGSPLVKVLDFGIARDTFDEKKRPTEEITATGVVIATVSHASPEQLVSSKHVGPATDQFSLATTLYEMLTATRAYPGEPPIAMTAVLTGKIPVLRDKVPSAPPELSDAIVRAQAKKPEHRFSSIAELARALAPFAAPEFVIHAERATRLLGEDPSLARSGSNAIARASLVPPGPGAPGSVPPNGGVRASQPPSATPPSGVTPVPPSASRPPTPGIAMAIPTPGSIAVGGRGSIPSTTPASGVSVARPPTSAPSSSAGVSAPVKSRPAGLLSMAYIVGIALAIILVMFVVRRATRHEPAPAASAPSTELQVVPQPTIAPSAGEGPAPELVDRPIVPSTTTTSASAAEPRVYPAFCDAPNAKHDKRYKTHCVGEPLDVAIRNHEWTIVKAILAPRMASLGCNDLQTLKTACRETGDPCAKTVGNLRTDKNCH